MQTEKFNNHTQPLGVCHKPDHFLAHSKRGSRKGFAGVLRHRFYEKLLTKSRFSKYSPNSDLFFLEHFFNSLLLPSQKFLSLNILLIHSPEYPLSHSSILSLAKVGTLGRMSQGEHSQSKRDFKFGFRERVPITEDIVHQKVVFLNEQMKIEKRPAASTFLKKWGPEISKAITHSLRTSTRLISLVNQISRFRVPGGGRQAIETADFRLQSQTSPGYSFPPRQDRERTLINFGSQSQTSPGIPFFPEEAYDSSPDPSLYESDIDFLQANEKKLGFQSFVSKASRIFNFGNIFPGNDRKGQFSERGWSQNTRSVSFLSRHSIYKKQLGHKGAQKAGDVGRSRFILFSPEKRTVSFSQIFPFVPLVRFHSRTRNDDLLPNLGLKTLEFSPQHNNGRGNERRYKNLSPNEEREGNPEVPFSHFPDLLSARVHIEHPSFVIGKAGEGLLKKSSIFTRFARVPSLLSNALLPFLRNSMGMTSLNRFFFRIGLDSKGFNPAHYARLKAREDAIPKFAFSSADITTRMGSSTLKNIMKKTPSSSGFMKIIHSWMFMPENHTLFSRIHPRGEALNYRVHPASENFGFPFHLPMNFEYSPYGLVQRKKYISQTVISKCSGGSHLASNLRFLSPLSTRERTRPIYGSDKFGGGQSAFPSLQSAISEIEHLSRAKFQETGGEERGSSFKPLSIKADHKKQENLSFDNHTNFLINHPASGSTKNTKLKFPSAFLHLCERFQILPWLAPSLKLWRSRKSGYRFDFLRSRLVSVKPDHDELPVPEVQGATVEDPLRKPRSIFYPVHAIRFFQKSFQNLRKFVGSFAQFDIRKDGPRSNCLVATRAYPHPWTSRTTDQIFFPLMLPSSASKIQRQNPANSFFSQILKGAPCKRNFNPGWGDGIERRTPASRSHTAKAGQLRRWLCHHGKPWKGDGPFNGSTLEASGASQNRKILSILRFFLMGRGMQGLMKRRERIPFSLASREPSRAFDLLNPKRVIAENSMVRKEKPIHLEPMASVQNFLENNDGDLAFFANVFPENDKVRGGEEKIFSTTRLQQSKRRSQSKENQQPARVTFLSLASILSPPSQAPSWKGRVGKRISSLGNKAKETCSLFGHRNLLIKHSKPELHTVFNGPLGAEGEFHRRNDENTDSTISLLEFAGKKEHGVMENSLVREPESNFLSESPSFPRKIRHLDPKFGANMMLRGNTDNMTRSPTVGFGGNVPSKSLFERSGRNLFVSVPSSNPEVRNIRKQKQRVNPLLYNGENFPSSERELHFHGHRRNSQTGRPVGKPHFGFPEKIYYSTNAQQHQPSSPNVSKTQVINEWNVSGKMEQDPKKMKVSNAEFTRLANRVYDVILERVKRERQVRGW